MVRQSVYLGMSRADMQAQLSALQQAYFQLTTGKQIANVSYSQADGAKAVTYRAADLGVITAQIAELQQMLGLVRHARRQIRLIYR
jgi:hypothetical protein